MKRSPTALLGASLLAATLVGAPAMAASATSASAATRIPVSAWRGAGTTSGCPANGHTLPAGARTTTIADVDGDHRRDRLILDDAHGRVGILTASGHLALTRAVTGAGPGVHSVAASYLSDGITAVLGDDGRTAELAYYVNCGFVQPRGVNHRPYAFALYGWGAFGNNAAHLYNAGVRCTAVRGGHTLYGVDLVKTASLFRIRTTVVYTGDRGRTAVNGRVATTAGAYGSATPEVRRAKTVDCGPRVVGNGR